MMKKEKESVFTKEQIVKSTMFLEHRDVLTVVLEDGKTYSKEQVRKEIEKFYKKKDASPQKASF